MTKREREVTLRWYSVEGDKKASEDLRKDLVATKEKAVEYFKCSHWDRLQVDAVGRLLT